MDRDYDATYQISVLNRYVDALNSDLNGYLEEIKNLQEEGDFVGVLRYLKMTNALSEAVVSNTEIIKVLEACVGVPNILSALDRLHESEFVLTKDISHAIQTVIVSTS